MSRESHAKGKGRDRKALAMLEVIRHRYQAALPVVQRDRHIAGGKDLADLVADEIDDGLEVELGGEASLHTVDDRQFRRSLLLDLEQPLRLVEETGVLERDAQAARERDQELEIGVG